MRLEISAILETEGRLTKIKMPLNDEGFDGELVKAGVLGQKENEYLMTNVYCNYDAINSHLDIATDVEELNYLAQRLDSFDDNELAKYCAMVQTDDKKVLKDLINLTFNLENYKLQNDIQDYDDLGRAFVEQEAPGLDEIILKNIDFREVGKEKSEDEVSRFTDNGYIVHHTRDEYIYDGQFFPQYEYDDEYASNLLLAPVPNTTTGVTVRFPVSDTTMNRALRRLNTESIDKCFIPYCDSSHFEMSIDNLRMFENVGQLNKLAEKLMEIPKSKVSEFNEILKQSGATTAKALITLVDDFNIRPQNEKGLMERTIDGLTKTAIEKACVMGSDAKPHIDKLREIVIDMVNFWDLDEHYIDQFDMDVSDVIESTKPNNAMEMGGM